MRTFRIGAAQALAGATLVNAALDPHFDGQNGQPAIVPAPDFGNAHWAGASATGNGSPYWVGPGYPNRIVLDSDPASATLTYVGTGCSIWFSVTDVLGGLHEQGGIVWITVDGQPWVAVDTAVQTQATLPGVYANPVAGITINTPTPGPHVVVVTFHNDLSASADPFFGPVTNTTGVSVGPLIHPVRPNRANTGSGTVTVKALDATHVSIGGVGSYALGTTVPIGTWDLVLSPGTMVTNDQAQFTTNLIGVTILGAYIATASLTGATVTFPLCDSSGFLPAISYQTPLPDPAALPNPVQWLCLGWEEDPAHPVTTGYGSTGNTTNPNDAAWSITPAGQGFNPSQLAISHDGFGHGCMGLAVLPRGRFCVAQLKVPDSGYIRNPRLYAWDPDSDPDRNRYPPVPGDDLTVRLYGGLAASWAMVERDPMRELLASYSLGTAMGAYLDQHGAEWDVPRPFGSDDPPYAAILRFFSAARQQGGTIGFFQQALALLLGPGVPFTAQSLATGTTTSWVLGTSALGISTVLGGISPGAWQAQVTLPVHLLAIPPQVVDAYIAAMSPAGVTVVRQWV